MLNAFSSSAFDQLLAGSRNVLTCGGLGRRSRALPPQALEARSIRLPGRRQRLPACIRAGFGRSAAAAGAARFLPSFQNALRRQQRLRHHHCCQSEDVIGGVGVAQKLAHRRLPLPLRLVDMRARAASRRLALALAVSSC